MGTQRPRDVSGRAVAREDEPRYSVVWDAGHWAIWDGEQGRITGYFGKDEDERHSALRHAERMNEAS